MNRVIEAVYDFRAEDEFELDCQVGDRFVILNDSDPNWFEVRSARDSSMHGLVPKNYCRRVSLDKHSDSSKSPSLSKSTLASSPAPSSPAAKPEVPPLGVILYSFEPERFDELQVDKGDSVLILAQTQGWYLVKHLGKVAEPGLVPASYVQLTPVGSTTAQSEDLVKQSIPSVAEWKQRQPKLVPLSHAVGMAKLSTSSLPSRAPPPEMQPSSTSTHSLSAAMGGDVTSQAKSAMDSRHSPGLRQLFPVHVAASGELPETRRPSRHEGPNCLVTASLQSYQRLNGQVIFDVDVVRLGHITHRIHRTYEDFYALQKTLLAKFPKDAGQAGGKRILPYFPAPSADISDGLARRRKADINYYVQKLLILPDRIRKSGIVLDFFHPWEHDEQVPNLISVEAIDSKRYDSTALFMNKRKPPSILRGHPAGEINATGDPGENDVDKGRIKKRSLPTKLHSPTSPRYLHGQEIVDKVSKPSQSLKRVWEEESTLTVPTSHSPIVDAIKELYLSPTTGTDNGAVYNTSESKPHSNSMAVPNSVGMVPNVNTETYPPMYIKIKVIEQENVSFFKVFRNIQLLSLRQKMWDSLGIPSNRPLFYDDAVEGELMPLELEHDFQVAMQRARNNLLTIHL